MPDCCHSHILSHEPHGICRGCGTPIPHSEVILQKFWRCYYCGKTNPFGSNARGLVLPAAFAMLLAATAMWWAQPLS
jgi:hypothetical protein